mmetsp:Transcript_4661/g.6948  ORF Transcript_4661/g.6948 Transcript_4661/m.6948 type:complete len:214 (-) Transcript_4661:592-1233(-)
MRNTSAFRFVAAVKKPMWWFPSSFASKSTKEIQGSLLRSTFLISVMSALCDSLNWFSSSSCLLHALTVKLLAIFIVSSIVGYFPPLTMPKMSANMQDACQINSCASSLKFVELTARGKRLRLFQKGEPLSHLYSSGYLDMRFRTLLRYSSMYVSSASFTHAFISTLSASLNHFKTFCNVGKAYKKSFSNFLAYSSNPNFFMFSYIVDGSLNIL